MVSPCIRIVATCAWTGILLAQQSGGAETSWTTTVKELIEQSFKYGPFAFAILAGVAVWWLIREARAAADSAKPYVRAQARNFWLGAIAAGITCIAFASIGTQHWLTVESMHYFSGEIKDLKTYEEVDLDKFYLRKALKPPLGATPPLYDLSFVALQTNPFAQGQRFDIAYSKKESANRKTFEITYEGETGLTYRFEYDDLEVPRKLVKIPARVQPAGSTKTSITPFTAYAQTIPAMIFPALMSPQLAQSAAQGRSPVDQRLVELLQDARAGVGAKIDALDRLRGMDASTQKLYSETVTEREPFALTLIELSRHSDKELAAKARAVVDASGAEAALAQQLGSPRPEIRAAAEAAVFRVSAERAGRILKLAPPSAQTQRLSAQVLSGEKQQILAPVGSEGGDRYYVKANWDVNDKRAANCLTELFNRELISRRTLQEEQKIMAGRGERLVYWYTKDWALSMAERIRACGGKASFPGPQK